MNNNMMNNPEHCSDDTGIPHPEGCTLCSDAIVFPPGYIPVPIRWTSLKVLDRVTGVLIERKDIEISTESEIRWKETGKVIPQCVARRPTDQSTKRPGHVVASIEGQCYKVAHLVLWSFVGLPKPGQTDAAHWDDNRMNNRLKNLRWATRKQNIGDQIFTQNPDCVEKAEEGRAVWWWDDKHGKGRWIFP